MKEMSNKTGKYLNDLDHLKQSIVDLLTTPIGSRVICRDYGPNLFQLIDMPVNRILFSRIYAAVAEAIDKWEPMSKVEKITIDSITAIETKWLSPVTYTYYGWRSNSSSNQFEDYETNQSEAAILQQRPLITLTARYITKAFWTTSSWTSSNFEHSSSSCVCNVSVDLLI